MKDMTQGNPTRLIISFAIPMLIGNIFQQIYNVADTIIVGRFLGAGALAGVVLWLSQYREIKTGHRCPDLDCGKPDYCCLSAWYLRLRIFSKTFKRSRRRHRLLHHLSSHYIQLRNRQCHL